MTQPTMPPPGWYPSPDGQPVHRWWDGSQWTGNTQAGPASPQQPVNYGQQAGYGQQGGYAPQGGYPPQPYGYGQQPGGLPAAVHPAGISPSRPVGTLAKVIQAGLIASALVSVASIALELYGINAINEVLAGSLDLAPLEAYDNWGIVLAALLVVVLLTTGISWMVWHYRLAKGAPGRLERSPAMHAWSWVIPFIALWFPYQNTRAVQGVYGVAPPSWMPVWWLTFIGSSLLSSWSFSVLGADPDPEDFIRSSWLTVGAEVLHLIAVPFAYLIVRQLTAAAESRSSAQFTNPYA